jgi:hypothetical protein
MQLFLSLPKAATSIDHRKTKLFSFVLSCCCCYRLKKKESEDELVSYEAEAEAKSEAVHHPVDRQSVRSSYLQGRYILIHAFGFRLNVDLSRPKRLSNCFADLFGHTVTPHLTIFREKL